MCLACDTGLLALLGAVGNVDVRELYVIIIPSTYISTEKSLAGGLI